MKGLQDVISVSIVHPEFGQVDADKKGWVFDKNHKSQLLNLSCEDSVYGFDNLLQIYLKSSPEYDGRVSVPVLWDKKTEQIVNNESPEIIKMFNKEFDKFAKNKSLDLYP